jgi:putative ABC transport system permease protein
MEVMFGGLPIDHVSVPIEGIITSAASSIAVTLLASLVPAWSVTRITPMEALRVRGQKGEGFIMQHSWKLGLALLVPSVADTFFRRLPSQLWFFMVFVGVTLMVPITISVLERVIRYGMSALYGMPGWLGSMNVQRGKSRVTLTVSIIMVGAAMTVAMGGMEVSFKAEANRWIESAVGGDFWISNASSDMPMPLEIGQRIAQTPGIGAVTPERWMYVNTVGATNAQGFKERREVILFRIIDPATHSSVTSLRFNEDQDKADELLADFARGDAVFITGNIQQLFNVKRGDTLRLRTARGEQDFRVAGIIMDIFQGGRSIMGSWDDMRKYFGQNNASFFIAGLQSGADSKAAEQTLNDGLAKSRHLTIQTGDEWRAELRQQSSQFFLLFDAIVVIAVIVGALGVVNTMTMSVLERTREIGMLRSVGLTRTQTMWMVLAEAAVMGVIAAIFGVGAGVWLSHVMVAGMSRGSGWNISYVFPTASLYTSIVIAVVVSQLAAIYPTWRAVKTVIVETIKAE